jgi:hypothetical protein
MNAPLSLLRKTALALALSLAGVAGTFPLAPQSFAAPAPTIHAWAATSKLIDVTGYGFTPGRTVNVEVHTSSGWLIRSLDAKASQYYCIKGVCHPGGLLQLSIGVPGGAPFDRVIARNLYTGVWSNKVYL